MCGRRHALCLHTANVQKCDREGEGLFLNGKSTTISSKMSHVLPHGLDYAHLNDPSNIYTFSSWLYEFGISPFTVGPLFHNSQATARKCLSSCYLETNRVNFCSAVAQLVIHEVVPPVPTRSAFVLTMHIWCYTLKRRKTAPNQAHSCYAPRDCTIVFTVSFEFQK